MSETFKRQPPVCIFREGSVVVKIRENGSGGNAYFNATIDRVYTDRQSGEVKSARSFRVQDLRGLQALLTRACSEMEKRALRRTRS